MANTWTQEDLKKVAEALHGNSNIYVAGKNLGVLKDDDDSDLFYDAVCAAGNVFKCAECSTWKERDEIAPGYEDRCNDCEDEDEDEDES
jgi:hypothetical protein